MSNPCKWPVYPRGWRRISRKLRDLAGDRCQQCGRETPYLSIHHRGAPYPDGRPGDPGDKHDLRRENLVALCGQCHEAVDHIKKVRARKRLRLARKLDRIAAHRALGVGVGLIVYQEVPSWA